MSVCGLGCHPLSKNYLMHAACASNSCSETRGTRLAAGHLFPLTSTGDTMHWFRSSPTSADLLAQVLRPSRDPFAQTTSAELTPTFCCLLSSRLSATRST